MGASSKRTQGGRHGGTGHFIAQRVSAVALLLLAPWLVVSITLGMTRPATLATTPYVAAIDFLTMPLNAVGVILFLIAALYHMSIGMQVIVEDYIHKPVTKALLLLVNTLLTFAVGAGAIFAVLQINFGDF